MLQAKKPQAANAPGNCCASAQNHPEESAEDRGQSARKLRMFSVKSPTPSYGSCASSCFEPRKLPNVGGKIGHPPNQVTSLSPWEAKEALKKNENQHEGSPASKQRPHGSRVTPKLSWLWWCLVGFPYFEVTTSLELVIAKPVYQPGMVTKVFTGIIGCHRKGIAYALEQTSKTKAGNVTTRIVVPEYCNQLLVLQLIPVQLQPIPIPKLFCSHCANTF